MDRHKGLWGCGLAGWITLAVVWPHVAPGGADAVSIAGNAAVAAAFVIAGVAHRGWGRVTGDARAEWSSAALVAAGSAMLLLGALQLRVGALADGPRPAPAVRAAVAIPMLCLFAAATRARPPRPPSRWLLAAVAAGYALAGLALSTPGVNGALRRHDDAPAWLAVEVAVSAGWILLALRPARPRWWSPPLVLMAAGEASYAVGLHSDGLAEEVSAGFTLAAATVFLASATVRWHAAIAASSRRLLQLDADLGHAQIQLHRAERSEAERLHDARTAALGIDAALRGLGGGTDPELARMVHAELSRLLALLNSAGGVDPPRDFELDEALRPVLAMRRGPTPPVIADLGAHHAFGRPTATARALANVLTNALTHAQATAVEVRAETAGGRVMITVEDDGRGIPAPARAAALRRGTPGDRAPASAHGLGLHTAARAMAEQGGGLIIAPRPGGGTRIVLSLPAAGTPAMAE